MRIRLFVILALLFGVWTLLMIRAFYLQVIPNERLASLKTKIFERNITIETRRGTIYDRSGNELAVSMEAHSLFADPSIIENPKSLARRLSKKLGIPLSHLKKKIDQTEKRFIWIKRRLSPEVRKEIERWKEKGLGFVVEPKRIYPNDHLLSQTLGFIGSEGQGLEGVEYQYDRILRGRKKTIRLLRDARGRPLLENLEVFNQREDGSDIWLTIDSEIQHTLEEELLKAIQTYDAQSAVGIVLNPKTFEILAMANVPTFDLNHPDSAPLLLRRNRTITDPLEPGSTAKTFMIASGLAARIIEPRKIYNCEEGLLKVGDHYIREAEKDHKFGKLTVSEILAHSSNVGTSKIAFDVGAERFRETLTLFGFGQKTGVDLPGESAGILHPLPWRKHFLANTSFGHGIAVTPLQMAAAYATIANGGYLLQPFLLKQSLIAAERHEQFAQVERRVLEKEVADKLNLMLTMVTNVGGTGTKARVQGFPVAGKTGTAQKPNPEGRGYIPNAYMASFAGYFPAGDPQYVIYLAIDQPKKEYYGATVAAPTFARVASFIVQKDGLSPAEIYGDPLATTTSNSTPTPAPSAAQIASPNPNYRESKLNSLRPSLRDVVKELPHFNHQIEVRGFGRVNLVEELPQGRSSIKKKRIVLREP